MAANSRPKSLYDIWRNHHGFLVNPLQWTATHLDLVGCRFEDVPPIAAEPTKCNHGGNGQQSCKRTSNDSWKIAMNLFPIIKRNHLVNILVGEDRPFAYFGKGSSFHFQGQPVHQPAYIVFHRHKSPTRTRDTSPPLVGYVHYTSVSGDRRKQFEPCPGPVGTNNAVGARICQKRLAQTTPKDWCEDPYFLCHLLALAQLQEITLISSEPTIYTSRLLVTNVLDRENMLFYEAEVTSNLLSALQNPKDARMPVEWPTIRRKKVPYKPYASFASRLTAELVAPGPVCTHDLSTPSNASIGTVTKGTKTVKQARSQEVA